MAEKAPVEVKKLPEDAAEARLLDAWQTAEMLGVSRSMLHKLSHQKVNPVPSVRIGKARRYPLDKVRGWIGELNH